MVFITKVLKQKKLLLLLSFLGIFLYSCGGSSETTIEEEALNEEEVPEKLEEIINEVPDPTKVPWLLERTGADYDEKLPNDPSNVEKYEVTNNVAAINLGIYSTDVGYVSIYEQAQDAIEYLSSAKKLAEKLGVINVFDKNTVERFESNLDNRDSLSALINEALANTDEYLKKNDRNNIAALIFAGSFIEGLYISTELVANYPDELPEEAKNSLLVDLVKVIVDQEKPLNDLIKVLKSLEQEEEVASLVTQLEELSKLYADLNIQEQIKNNQGDLMLSDKTIESITTKVREIRTDLVK